MSALAGAGRVSVPVAGGALACWSRGTGPAVVLLHGLSFDHTLWEPQRTTLEDAHRVHRYDLRGHGRSSAPVAGRSHLDDLLEVLDHLGIGRASLVGLSLGANVALAAAAYHPDRVARLVLASSGLPGFAWRARPPDEAAEVARRDGVEAAKRFWLDHELFDSVRSSPAMPAIEAMVRAFPAHQWGAGPRADPLPPVEPRLGAVRAPTLVLSGGRDLEGYREISRVLARRIPGARLVELADAGHVLTLEDPKAVNAEIRGFLAAEAEEADERLAAQRAGSATSEPPPERERRTST